MMQSFILRTGDNTTTESPKGATAQKNKRLKFVFMSLSVDAFNEAIQRITNISMKQSNELPINEWHKAVIPSNN